jgi:hypothetical protein
MAFITTRDCTIIIDMQSLSAATQRLERIRE